ncbi:RES domain-containing protein [Mesorhizobium sp. LHD-90]|uniref:RES family NAD+ phosphorylase n=1 Tax=Mesorhizobium sp. LHD-90 TaxID=3071414 RepID=UPI0027E1F8DD|nr:RES domain-containing protein [Mesorhizobium sp. LHD-90]MDQ6436156.1 RES domain-containing protein [Mesorhizobium sp. LHD-90]
MRFAGDCYRAHNPKWSFSPLSGDGAAIHGGRFNPRGVPALYLGLTIEGAVIEASQGFSAKLEPLTICLYEVDCEDILDLSTGEGRSAAGASLDDMACAWALDAAERRKPASWTLARSLIAAGAAGIVAPSFARGTRPDMRNLVLWKWGPDLPWRVRVHDPSGRLPKDMLSWK